MQLRVIKVYIFMGMLGRGLQLLWEIEKLVKK